MHMASSQLPAKEYVAFLIAISSFFGIFGAASSTVPSTVYIGKMNFSFFFPYLKYTYNIFRHFTTQRT